MGLKLNDPIWILGQIEGYFDRYMDDRDPYGRVMVGVPSLRGGVPAIVPREWITPRDDWMANRGKT